MAIDLKVLAQTFERLHDFVATEPQLAAFVAAAEELRQQAADLERGTREIPAITDASNKKIPSRQLAAALVDILSEIPPLSATEDEELVLALARLLGNLVDGVTHAVLVDYPDLIPRSP